MIKATIDKNGVVLSVWTEDNDRKILDDGTSWAVLSNKEMPALDPEVSAFLDERTRKPNCFKVVDGMIVARTLDEIKADLKVI